MSRTKQRSAFDQVSELDRGRIVAYRDCELSFREIGSRTVQNQKTLMRICDCWMQEVHIAGTLNRQRYISEVLEPVVLPFLQGLTSALFQQDKVRSHVARIVQRFFVNHQIELRPWPARFPDLSPMEIMWSVVAQRLTQITPHLPNQTYFGNVWKLLRLLYSKNTSKVPLNQCRGVGQR
ncbi:transposable element Tcb1 transposase [Trichonephila clavipes]|nr:transposable element Tcb1 transposase [Trichonephila clavipes]